MNLFGRARTFESLHIRDYRLLWLGQLSTSMGQWMDQVSRTWLIYSMTGSALQLGLVSAARGVPLLVFGTLAGAVADRYGRKTQLIIAQVANAFLNVTLATLILTGRIEVWHIYVTGFLNGTVQAFQNPARQVLINDLVGEKHLLNAISLNSAALNLSRSVGPAICGLLIEFLGVDISYYTQAVLFIVATVWTVQIKVPERVDKPARSGVDNQSLLGSTREGIDYILKHRLIMALIVLGLAPVALGMPFMSLMPIFAIDIYGGGAETQGLLLTMVGIGAVLGALIMASIGQGQTSGKLLVVGAIGFGLSLVLFSQSPVLVLALVWTFVAGLFNSSYTSQNQTILQLVVPSELRGRVMGIYLLNRGLMPLGSIVAGALASALGGPWAVTLMGSSCVLLALGVALFERRLWRLDLATVAAIE